MSSYRDLRSRSNVLILGCSTLAATMMGCPRPEPTSVESQEQVSLPPAESDWWVRTDTLHPAPPDFARQRIGDAEYPIPHDAKFLAGVRICLDPGHGGDAEKRSFKRGPTGVREAEINLRVAQYLRELLATAGAEVRLTRESDVDLSHADRAAVANDWPADFFISCHHNAIDNKPQTNYTTVWYHADVDYRSSSLDLARYLCDGLYEALNFPEPNGVPLKSDQLMYDTGFAVLRHAEVAAALVESSFYTHPEEEQRLRDPEYNLREAYGLFLGLAQYAAAGLPRARLLNPSDGAVKAGASALLELELDDGLRGRKAWGHERQMILSDSIVVGLDGQRVEHAFSNDGYRLTIHTPASLSAGVHRLTIQFENLFKNAVLNPDFEITAR